MANLSFKYDKKFVTEEGKDSYRFVVSTSDIDRVGDLVVIDGIDTNEYEKNPIVLYNHAGTPIGTSKIFKRENTLYGDVVFDGITEQSKIVKNLVDKGTLRTASIGIEVLESYTRGLTDKEKKESTRNYFSEVRVIKKGILIEWSIVDMPANINAKLEHGLNNLQKIYKQIKELKDMAYSISEEELSVLLENLDAITEIIAEVTDNITAITDVVQGTVNILTTVEEDVEVIEEVEAEEAKSKDKSKEKKSLLSTTRKIDRLKQRLKR